VKWGGKFLFYYGGADKFVGVAESPVTGGEKPALLRNDGEA